MYSYPTTYGTTYGTNYYPTSSYGSTQSGQRRCQNNTLEQLGDKLGNKTKKKIERYRELERDLQSIDKDIQNCRYKNPKNPDSCRKYENKKADKRKDQIESINNLFERSKKKSKKFINKVISNPTEENLTKFTCYLTLLNNSYQNCSTSKNINIFIEEFVKSQSVPPVVSPEHDKLYINTILNDKPTEAAMSSIKQNTSKNQYKDKIIKQIDAYTVPKCS